MLKNFTLPEWLAFFRVITFPVMIALVFFVEKDVYGWIYLICFSTDVLDGVFAFVFKNDSARRAVLDTWGDNGYMIAGLIGVYYFETTFIESYLYVIVAVVGLYILELIMSLIKFGRSSHFHNYLAKVAAFCQFAFFIFAFFFKANAFLFSLAAFFSVLDVIDQIIILSKVKKWRTKVNGFWQVI